MTPTKSHTELHRRSAEIAEQTRAFEQSGKAITQVDIGVTGYGQKLKRYVAPKKRAGGRPKVAA